MRAYLVEAAQYWLGLGVDGFRLDHAHGATHAFWSAFRAGTRAVRADSVTVGEVTDTPTVMRSYVGRMDGVLDFQLLELLRGFFVFNRLTASQFDLALNTVARAYRELEQDGVLETRGRHGSFIATSGDPTRDAAGRAATDYLATIRRLGLPDSDVLGFVEAALNASWAARARDSR